MPRWITAFFVAIMLSCYGFAVFAHSVSGVERSDADTTATACLSTLASAEHHGHSPLDTTDDAASHDENGSEHFEHFELVGAPPQLPMPLFVSEQPPKLALTPTLSPFLERPKRPPRAAFLRA